MSRFWQSTSPPRPPATSPSLVDVSPKGLCPFSLCGSLLCLLWRHSAKQRLVQSLSYLNLKSIPCYKFYCFPLSYHWGNQGLNQLINLSGSEAGRKRQSWDLNQVRTDSRGWVLNCCSTKLLHHLTTASSISSLEIDANPVSHPVYNWSRNKIFFHYYIFIFPLCLPSLYSPCHWVKYFLLALDGKSVDGDGWKLKLLQF